MTKKAAPENWTRALPLNPPELTDNQWLTFSRASGFPESARPQITAAVSFYQIAEKTRVSSKTPAQTKNLLAAAAARATDLQYHLGDIVQNPLATSCLTHASKIDSVGAALPDLREMTRAMAELSNWLSAASNHIAGGNSGAHMKSVQVNVTISLLNKIYEEFKTKPLSRTQNAKSGEKTPTEFVKAFFQIADPSVGSSSIEEGLKRLVKNRGGIRKQDGR